MKTLNLKSLFLGLGILAAPLAYAQGDHTGGGGDILKCLENGKPVYRLLDTWEAKERKIDVELGPDTLSVKQKIQYAMLRYSRLDPKRAKLYGEGALEMLDDIEALESGNLTTPHSLVKFVYFPMVDIDDAGESFDFRRLDKDQEPTKERCAKGQLVIQDEPLISTDRFYTINYKHWKNLDFDQKAATLLHEVIVKDFRANHFSITKRARILNGEILSNAFPKMSTAQYIEFIQQLGLDRFQLGSFNLYINDFPRGFGVNDHGEINQLSGNGFEVKVGGFEFRISNPLLNDAHQIIEGQSDDDFEIDRVKKTIKVRYGAYPSYKGGTVEFLSNQTISFKGLKASEEGSASLISDLKGNIISFQENGYFNNSLDSETRKLMNDLFGCMKKRLQKKKTQVGNEVIFEEARYAVVNGDKTKLNSLINDCKKGVAPASAHPISKWSKQVTQKLSKSALMVCSETEFGGGAALLVGASAEIQFQTCTFTDGMTRTYVGIGLGAHLGAGVYLNESQSEIKGIAAGKVGSAYVEVVGGSDEPQALAGAISDQSQYNQGQGSNDFSNRSSGSYSDINTWDGSAIGLFYGVDFKANGFIQVWKSSSFQDLINDLLREIMVEKPLAETTK